MPLSEWIGLFLFVALLLLSIPLLGNYITAVFNGDVQFLSRAEAGIYSLSGVDPKEEMTWRQYIVNLLIFNAIGFLFLFLLLLLQNLLPLNPQKLAGVPWPLAFNIASSFVTNTNWQSYVPEVTLSPLSQMLGLTVQNFLSAATGFAVLIALARSLQRKTSGTIGNFWSDFTKGFLYILLPLSFLFAIFLMSQGVPQTLGNVVEVTTLENQIQKIPLGPVASQVAIKQLGTNGGGYYNANSAHPLENPSPLTNFFENLALLVIPAASVYAYGKITGARKHAWILLAVMFCLWGAGLAIAQASQLTLNPLFSHAPILEGQETRFGNFGSVLWGMSTTATSNGSVNSMLSSLSPLAGGMALFNILLGELIFGGVGVGLGSMLIFVLLTVFLAGLMVGRTPEYLGKKLEKTEMQWVIISLLAPGALVLLGSGFSALIPKVMQYLGHQGPHGLTELLYAFGSAAGNNGSAFAGLNSNNDYFNLFLGATMLLARLAILIPLVAIAGLLAAKKTTPSSVGTFEIDSSLFFVLLMCVIVIVGGLTFFPALALGPLAEQELMFRGVAF